MKLKNTAQVFLTLMSLFLVFAPSAHAEDQVQQQTGIIDALKNNWNALWVDGKVLFSALSYQISNHDNVNAEETSVTTQDDLNFWNDLKAQYPFSEKPVFISKDSVCRPAYDFLPKGVTEVTVTDNSENALDSYTITKNETGFTILKGAANSPDKSYTITLNKIEQSYAIYSKIGLFNSYEEYVKEQIQAQA